MYICPICNRKFKNTDDVAKHSLKCWKEKNPNHKSKAAPRSEDIVERSINSDIQSFFSSFQEVK